MPANQEHLMIPDQYIQILTDLELTLLQAKAYINLARIGKADVNTISKASNLARSDAYRVMLVLERLGLAEKIIDKKTVYKATPIKEGISILLKNKKKRYDEIEKKSRLLLYSFHDNDSQDSQAENQQFIITSESTLFRMRFEKSFSEAKTCKMMIQAAGLKYAMFHFFECIKTALKKGAKIHIIAEKTEDAAVNKKLRSLEKNPLFEIRFANASHINFAVTVFNDKEVHLCISPNSEVPSLYSNNAQAVEEALMLFESVWNNSEVHKRVYEPAIPKKKSNK
jgi:sugar-specific transcriptional regulator TrmB